ncbi:MAG TPA: 8-oxo-dGTP diphosphatase [Patescibacteria group bacterium]|nr:8-oxo-dGTP diphosphatase [Patescibacteria group bacterium]
MLNLRQSTLVFLLKKEGKTVREVCLALKKRGFGVGRWNGVGGKVEPGEKVEKAVRREAREEIGVELRTVRKVAELSFYFPHKPDWDQQVLVYFSHDWVGEPIETEEMRPAWYPEEKIPYDLMWPDDVFWLPEVLKGNLVRASFIFEEGDKIKVSEVKTVDKF